jgi:RNA polymerase sigma factor (sigma-70 family)
LESLKVPDHSSQLDSSQQLRKVYKILATIPENKRSVFDLYVVDEFSEAEIARIKGMKKQQVHETIDEVIKNIKAKF